MIKLTKGDLKALRRIRKMVLATHWIKGEYFEPKNEDLGVDKDSYCLVGMVNLVTGLKGEEMYANSNQDELLVWEKGAGYVHKVLPKQRGRLLAAIGEAVKAKAPRAKMIETFNDRKSTKRQHIVEVLDAVLGQEEGQ